MKRAIFKNYIIILLLALILSGSIFCAAIGNILLDKTRENLLNIIKIIDQSLDYKKDLKKQKKIRNIIYLNE
ncbi:MAG TPA: hypothetical protein PK304_01405, partial [Mobilitalea sp.]|nr:hypothetical protein [Mobilitalea sp.]